MVDKRYPNDKPRTLKVFGRTQNALNRIKQPGQSYDKLIIYLVKVCERYEHKQYYY
jgi:hypothetical protein